MALAAARPLGRAYRACRAQPWPLARSFSAFPGQRAPDSPCCAYTELGLGRDASPDEVKRAYKKLAMQHHPDRGGNAEKFKAVTRAYEVLRDPRETIKRSGGDGGPIFQLIFVSWL